MPSVSKKRSSRTKKSANRPLGVFNDAPTPVYLKVIIAVVLVLLLVWFLFFMGGHRYSVGSNEVKNRIQATLEATQLSGKQLALNVEDLGCDSGTSVGLRTRIECYMEGYKYVEITGDKKAALALANAKIESLGFKKEPNGDYENQVLDGAKEGDVHYVNKLTTARLGWSTFPPSSVNGPGSTAISEALSSHRINTPNDGITVVGVVVREVYWTCSSGNLDMWGLSCSFPPHVPNQ
ncbi:hypothetical protein SAMN04489729_5522 [Amycolatopsis lurida]|uniref:hypothetical protein n=1 Tax=Amycolatopsis lurida TaxID=31959 RepID=UPI000897486F|nr:hypothetical protein [Amycolatopsis lurida]SED86058.1 hypothetical protein SAMN04489729_5522 [Amycolatopsis lurida]